MEPIRKKSAVDLVVETLLEYIQSSNVAVNQKMPAELTLCKELGIGRSTIREAYRILQSQGYLAILPDRGAFVLSKEPSYLYQSEEWLKNHKIESSDYLRVRMALDPLAAELAAANATPQQLEELQNAHRQFVACVNEKNPAELANLDASFHEKIAMASQNELLITLISIVNYYVKLLRQDSFRDELHAQHAIEPHGRILQAILAHDAERAREESIAHMKLAMEDLDNQTNNA